jgi:hypothetical protein
LRAVLTALNGRLTYRYAYAPTGAYAVRLGSGDLCLVFDSLMILGTIIRAFFDVSRVDARHPLIELRAVGACSRCHLDFLFTLEACLTPSYEATDGALQIFLIITKCRRFGKFSDLDGFA